MDKLAQHVQATALHAQAGRCVRLANQDMVYKVICAAPAPLELISTAKHAQHVQVIVLHAQVALCVRLVNQDMAYNLICAALAPLEPI